MFPVTMPRREILDNGFRLPTGQQLRQRIAARRGHDVEQNPFAWSLITTPDGHQIGVDRSGEVLRGYVVAKFGDFKSPGRGRFNLQSLETIRDLLNSGPGTPIKSNFSHPKRENDQGLGRFLGRVRDAWLDGDRVRADLHLDPGAHDSPEGDLVTYLVGIATHDRSAVSSSLSMTMDVLRDPAHPGLAPLWIPTQLFSSDIVSEGDAVDGLLELRISNIPPASLADRRQFGKLTIKERRLFSLHVRQTAADMEGRMVLDSRGDPYADSRLGFSRLIRFRHQ
jgi:hypothetical protein